MATQSVRDISWVVFDLGGVIIRIHHSWQEAAAVAKVQCHSDPALDPTKHRAAEFKNLFQGISAAFFRMIFFARA